MKDIKVFQKTKNKKVHEHERYKNLPEDEKQRLVEYRNDITKSEKTLHFN